jgi:phenylalanyl-tRNA synthetase beta chain
MIITKNWLNEWLDVSNYSLEELALNLNKIGLEVDSVQQYSAPKGVVVGYVDEVEKHPDADKLKVCQVKLTPNSDEKTQIVTNAKNVTQGCYVPVATVGTKLPDLKIKKGKLRGVESLGMFCSTEEFGMPRIGEGVAILDDSIGELKIGQELSELEPFNDGMIEIELTANRGDALSIRGVARDLSAILNIPLKTADIKVDQKYYNSREVKLTKVKSDYNFKLDYKELDLSEKLTTPFILAYRLAIINKYSENNHILNFVNYAIHSTNIMLKTFYLDQPVESLTLKKENNFIKSYLNNSLVSTVGLNIESDKNGSGTLVLETSFVNPVAISKAVYEAEQQKIKIEKDSLYYNSSRGSETDIMLGINYLLSLFADFNYLNKYTFIRNISCFADNIQFINFTVSDINNLIGAEISYQKIKNILESLQFNIEETDEETGKFSVLAPEFKQYEILNLSDISEEILRIHGILSIESKPLNFTEKNRKNRTTSNFEIKNRIRNRAVSQGFNESVLYIFNEKSRLEELGFKTFENNQKLLNPIVDTMDTLRPTLMLGLLDAVEKNRKFGKEVISLFEIGSVFDENREESQSMAFVWSGKTAKSSLQNGGKASDIDFETFARKILSVFGNIEFKQAEAENSLMHPFQTAKIILNVGDEQKEIGSIYKLHLKTQEKFDLDATYCAEINDVETLFSKVAENGVKQAKNYSKFQASKKDLSLVIDKKITYIEIKNLIESLEVALIKEFYPLDIYSDEVLSGEDKHSLTIRFILQSDDKTLSDEEITTTTETVFNAISEKFGAVLR